MSANSLTPIMWGEKRNQLPLICDFPSCEKIIDKKSCKIGDARFSNMSASTESHWAVLDCETVQSHEANYSRVSISTEG